MSDTPHSDYHYILTLQGRFNGRLGIATYSGVYTWQPGDSRQKVFNGLFEVVKEKWQLEGNISVLFFDLSPNLF